MVPSPCTLRPRSPSFISASWTAWRATAARLMNRARPGPPGGRQPRQRVGGPQGGGQVEHRLLLVGGAGVDPVPDRALRAVGYDDWLTFECRLRGEPEEALPASTRFLAGFL